MCLIIIIHKKNKPKELYQVHFGSFANGFFEIPADCSKGTYIRALARDIGVALGSGAHLTALRRTRIGDIAVENCESVEHLIERLDSEEMVSPDRAEQERLEQEREKNRAMARQRKAEQALKREMRKSRQSQL